jgi:hypothetical protein
MMKRAEPIDKTICHRPICSIIHLLQPGAETNNLGNGTLATPLWTYKDINLVQVDVHTFDGPNITDD